MLQSKKYLLTTPQSALRASSSPYTGEPLECAVYKVKFWCGVGFSAERLRELRTRYHLFNTWLVYMYICENRDVFSCFKQPSCTKKDISVRHFAIMTASIYGNLYRNCAFLGNKRITNSLFSTS